MKRWWWKYGNNVPHWGDAKIKNIRTNLPEILLGIENIDKNDCVLTSTFSAVHTALYLSINPSFGSSFSSIWPQEIQIMTKLFKTEFVLNSVVILMTTPPPSPYQAQVSSCLPLKMWALSTLLLPPCLLLAALLSPWWTPTHLQP